MSQTTIRPTSRPSTRPSLPRAKWPKGAAAPVLVEVRRGGVVESRHRGHIAQVDAKGKLERAVGDPDVSVTLRSAIKPFGVAALIDAGGADAFHLTDAEIAVMAASHAGEDAHVRTVQAVLRRAGLSQSLLACGAEGMPLDRLTAARLAREGEAPGPLRHMCSGYHTAFLLLSRIRGWSLPDYWHPEHPSQQATDDVIARIFNVRPSALTKAIDNCGVATFAFPLAAIARAFALLADPTTAAAGNPAQVALVPALTRIRDAMLAAPDMVGGARQSTDTKLMRTRPQSLVAKGGAEGLRGIGMLAGARGAGSSAAGLAIKIEDGDYFGRAGQAAVVEALAQLGALDAATVERLKEMHNPPSRDPRGMQIAAAAPVFQLAPLSELS